MRSSIRRFSSGIGPSGPLGPGEPKFLVPPPTFSEIAGAALYGVWAHLTNQTARDTYEQAVKDGVIKDAVLASASNGSIMTYSLFHNLYGDGDTSENSVQGPPACYFRKHKFDPKEFVQAVDPAIENFHYALGTLRNQVVMDEETNEDAIEKSDDDTPEADADSDKVMKDVKEALLGANMWRVMAEKDPDSPAGILSRMTTEHCLDALYYSAKLNDVLMGAAGQSSVGSPGLPPDEINPVKERMVFDDCVVNEVALMSARAAVIRKDGNIEFEEFQASEPEVNGPIAAQMEVLFETTLTFKPSSLKAKENVSDSERASDSSSSNDKQDDEDGRTMSYTNLAVAVFEGWLSGDPNGGDLRWKLAQMRDAYEFPLSSPAVTRQ